MKGEDEMLKVERKETRLERLKRERKTIESLSCLSFNLVEQCRDYYDHEIKCIEEYGSPNPTYND